MIIPDKLRQYIKSRQTEKNANKKRLSLYTSPVKERQSLFFLYSDAHTALAADRQETEEIFRQKAHLKAALIFCHVPQRDVMVPAQIEKTLRFTARHTNPHSAFPESLSLLQTHTPFSALE